MKPFNELLNLSGKSAIVTGGAVGIGQAVSYRLAEAGAKVLIVDISEDNLDIARKFFNDKNLQVEFLQKDVSSQEAIDRMCSLAIEKFGSIDILVNNAGIYPNILLMNMTAADFERVINVNLKSAFMATKQVAEQMIKQGTGGRIINITSIDALHPSSAGLAHYDASKHGLWGFTKNVALELAPHNIWVNAVAPGGILSPGVEEIQKSMELPKGVDMSKLLEQFLGSIPMKRLGDADEIGKAVLFLASDMSSYMTGSQIVVDGGALLA